MEKLRPDYRQIYFDIVIAKFPDKKKYCEPYFKKPELSVMDILNLNKILFETEKEVENRKFKSYTKKDIFSILDYQKKNKINNSQLAIHFKLSRNTITKWRKIYLL